MRIAKQTRRAALSLLLLGILGVSALAVRIETEVSGDALAFARVYGAEEGAMTCLAFYDAQTGALENAVFGEGDISAKLSTEKCTELRQMLLDGSYSPLAPAYRTLIAAGRAELGSREYDSLCVINDASLTGNMTVLNKLQCAGDSKLSLPEGSVLSLGVGASVPERLCLAGEGTLRLDRFTGGRITFNGVHAGDAFVAADDGLSICVNGVKQGSVSVIGLELGTRDDGGAGVSFTEADLSLFDLIYSDAGLRLRLRDDSAPNIWDVSKARLTLSVSGGGKTGTLVYDTLAELKRTPSEQTALSLLRLEDGSCTVNGGSTVLDNICFNEAVTLALDENTVPDENGWCGEVTFRNCEFAGGLTIAAAEGMDFAVCFNNDCLFDGKTVTVSGENVNLDPRRCVHLRQIPTRGFAVNTDTAMQLDGRGDPANIPDNARFTVNGVAIKNNASGPGFYVNVEKMNGERLRVSVAAEEQRRGEDGRPLTGDKANGCVEVGSSDSGAFAAVAGYVDISGFKAGTVVLTSWRRNNTVVLGGSTLTVPESADGSSIKAVGAGTIVLESARADIVRALSAYAESDDRMPLAELYEGDDGSGGIVRGVSLWFGEDSGYERLSALLTGATLNAIDGENDEKLHSPDSPAAVMWLDSYNNIIDTAVENWRDGVRKAVITAESFDDDTRDVSLALSSGALCSVIYRPLNYGWTYDTDLCGFTAALLKSLDKAGYGRLKLNGYKVSKYLACDENGEWSGPDKLYKLLLSALREARPDIVWETWGSKYDRVMLGTLVKLAPGVADRIPAGSIRYSDALGALNTVWSAAKSVPMPDLVKLPGRTSDSTEPFNRRENDALTESFIAALAGVYSTEDLVRVLSAGIGEVTVCAELALTGETLEELLGDEDCEALTREEDGLVLAVPALTTLSIGREAQGDGCGITVGDGVTLRLSGNGEQSSARLVNHGTVSANAVYVGAYGIFDNRGECTVKTLAADGDGAYVSSAGGWTQTGRLTLANGAELDFMIQDGSAVSFAGDDAAWSADASSRFVIGVREGENGAIAGAQDSTALLEMLRDRSGGEESRGALRLDMTAKTSAGLDKLIALAELGKPTKVLSLRILGDCTASGGELSCAALRLCDDATLTLTNGIKLSTDSITGAGMIELKQGATLKYITADSTIKLRNLSGTIEKIEME